MIKELVTDEALLSTPCEPATVEDIAVATDLTDTLASLENAGCLAANQIGVTRALFAFEDESGAVRVMANPKVLFGLGADKVEESCLTHEGISRVTRYIKIKLSYDEFVDGELRHRKGEFVGWEAQICLLYTSSVPVGLHERKMGSSSRVDDPNRLHGRLSCVFYA